jgi:hypothetical protein
MNLNRISTLADNLRIIVDIIREKEKQIADNFKRSEDITNHKYGDLDKNIPLLSQDSSKLLRELDFDKKHLVETIKHLNDELGYY